MKIRLQFRYLLFLFVVISFDASGKELPSIDLTQTDSVHQIGNKISVFEDRSSSLSFEEVLQQGEFERRAAIYSSRNVESTFWVKVRVTNQNPDVNRWMLEAPNGYWTHFDLYDPHQPDKVLKSGVNHRFSERDYPFEFMAHEVNLKHLETGVYYFKCKSNVPLTFNLRILSHQKSLEIHTALNNYLGMYYGIVLVLFLYSVLNYIAVKNKSYLWFGLYIISLSFILYAFDGKSARYFFAEYPYLNIRFFTIVVPVSAFLALNYTRSFFNTSVVVPKLNRAISILQMLLFVFVPVSFFLPIKGVIFVTRFVPIPFLALIILTALICTKRGQRSGVYFLLGFGTFAVGAAITNLSYELYLPVNLFTSYAVHGGSAIEAVFLIFALSREMSDMKKQTEVAQIELIEQLTENEALQSKVNRELEQKVAERTEEINNQKELIEQKNKDITDSIQYGQRIQQAILPDEQSLKEALRDCFVLFQPKDIVSGDFYWVEMKDDKALFAAVDCTGHGVPGAFVSMVGYNRLNQIVFDNGITTPSLILEELNKYINLTLNQETRKTSVMDGMDIALCAIDWKNKELEFSGAMNPFYLVRDGEVIVTKGDRIAIGGSFLSGRDNFTNHQLKLETGDCIYVFSDGYVDQFGGPHYRKFMSKKFKELLLEIHEKPMQEQHQVLIKTLKDWMGEREQIDDILVLGVRVD